MNQPGTKDEEEEEENWGEKFERNDLAEQKLLLLEEKAKLMDLHLVKPFVDEILAAQSEECSAKDIRLAYDCLETVGQTIYTEAELQIAKNILSTIK